MAVKLSILIPTVSSRESLLSRMLWSIEHQLTPEVEVLVYPGDNIAFGDKVTRMHQLAKGEFSFVADDDDYLASDAIPLILQAISDDVDYISYGVVHSHDGVFQGIVNSSIHGDKNWEKSPYTVHHKCAVRTKLAKQVPLGNHYRCDRDWSVAAQQLMQAEKIIPRALYFYDYWSNGTVGTVPSDQNKETQRNVGIYPYNRDAFTWL